MADSPERRERAVLAALGAISRIEPRPWPEGEKPYTFAESFEDDVSAIRRFVRRRGVFARTSEYLERNSWVIILISTPYHLYYLPAVLRAMVERPQGQLSNDQLTYLLGRGREGMTEAEREATDRVADLLALHGVTREGLERRVAEGRRLYQEWRAQGGGDPAALLAEHRPEIVAALDAAGA